MNEQTLGTPYTCEDCGFQSVNMEDFVREPDGFVCKKCHKADAE